MKSIKNTLIRMIFSTLAVSSAITTPRVATAQATQATASQLSPGLENFLRQDIERRKEVITAQERSIEEFKKILSKAKMVRGTSVVVNSLEAVGAVVFTRFLLKGVLTKTTGTLIALGFGATILADAGISVKVRFSNVAKIEKGIAELEANIKEDRKDLADLYESFTRLGPDARDHLKEIVKNRSADLNDLKAHLDELKIELEISRRSYNKSEGYKIPAYSAAGLVAVLGAAGIVAGITGSGMGALVAEIFGAGGIALGGAIYSISSKFVSVNATDFEAINRKVIALQYQVTVEERTQTEFLNLLLN